MATYVHGKGAGFFMDNAAATQVDFSSIVTDAKLSIQLSTAETSHFGSSPKTYIAGQNEATGSVSGLFDRAQLLVLTTAFNALMAGTVLSLLVTLAPEGIATGSTKISQQMIMTQIDIGAAVGGVVSVSFNLIRTGATTFSAY
jgi:hypothetical protein